MVAGVLIKVYPMKTKSVYEQIKSIEGVSNITAVFGRFDMVVMIRALDIDAAAKLVSRIRSIDGVLSTETLVATSL
jgi:DNA-binding Lrp family transcriptional regulator